MARIIDSPALFGHGAGFSTSKRLECELCGHIYNPTDDEDFDDYVRHEIFLGMDVAECCFEKVEDEILRHMPELILWFQRILEGRRERLTRQEEALQRLIEALSKTKPA